VWDWLIGFLFDSAVVAKQNEEPRRGQTAVKIWLQGLAVFAAIAVLFAAVYLIGRTLG
jgi:fatty acid desaturase